MSEDQQSSIWATIIKKVIHFFVGLLGTGQVKAAMDQHVMPQQDKWIVRSSDRSSTVQKFENKQSAISYAKDVAKQLKSQVVIYDKAGVVTQKFSFRTV